MQHRRVRAAADDGVERQSVSAVAQERCLELDLELSLAHSTSDQRQQCGEAGASRALGLAHALELELVLLTPDMVERSPKLGCQSCGGRHSRHAPAQTSDANAVPSLEPSGQ